MKKLRSRRQMGLIVITILFWLKKSLLNDIGFGCFLFPSLNTSAHHNHKQQRERERERRH